MGGLCEVQIAAAVDALVTRNIEAAEQTVLDDVRIDALEIEAEALAVRIIALRAPMADDLREVIAVLARALGSEDAFVVILPPSETGVPAWPVDADHEPGVRIGLVQRRGATDGASAGNG
jgi:hypothetical protein